MLPNRESGPQNQPSANVATCRLPVVPCLAVAARYPSTIPSPLSGSAYPGTPSVQAGPETVRSSAQPLRDNPSGANRVPPWPGPRLLRPHQPRTPAGCPRPCCPRDESSAIRSQFRRAGAGAGSPAGAPTGQSRPPTSGGPDARSLSRSKQGQSGPRTCLKIGRRLANTYYECPRIILRNQGPTPSRLSASVHGRRPSPPADPIGLHDFPLRERRNAT